MNSPFQILLNPAEKKSTHASNVTLIETSGRYKLGKATRPPIVHDNGHLEKYAKREPTSEDKKHYAKWIAILEGAEAGCGPLTGNVNPLCDFESLEDGLAAYRHFLFGKGADRYFDYERYLRSDPAAKTLLVDLIADFQYHAEVIGQDRVSFDVTSTEYNIGGVNAFSGYPRTTNWVRAIGGHSLWVSGRVTASVNEMGKICFNADIVIHVEDRYNFNADQADKSTGIPDSENGTFEITGLAHQYTN